MTPDSVKTPSKAPEAKTTDTDVKVNAAANIHATRGKDREDGSLRLAVTPPPEAVYAKRREYWLGVIKECSYNNVTVGGISFPRWTGSASFDEKGVPFGGKIDPGARVKLSDAQVEACLQSIARRIIRPFGVGGNGKRRHQLLSIDSPAYRPSIKDRPLADFIYILRTDVMGFGARDEDPTVLTAPPVASSPSSG